MSMMSLMNYLPTVVSRAASLRFEDLYLGLGDEDDAPVATVNRRL